MKIQLMATLCWLTLAGVVAAQNAQPKILARTAYRPGPAGPAVIRTANEKVTADIAAAFKLPGIDWTKQMVIVVSGGPQPTGGYGIIAKSVEIKGNRLVVNWELLRPDPSSNVTQAFTHPTVTILVDRFDGDVEFNPKAPMRGDV